MPQTIPSVTSPIIRVDSGILDLPDYFGRNRQTPRQRFGLPADEKLITSTKCYGFTMGIPQWAKLYLYQNYLCFRTLISPGYFKSVVKRPWTDVVNVTNSGTLMQGMRLDFVDGTKSSLEFISKEDRDRIYDAILRLMQRAKQSGLSVTDTPGTLETQDEEEDDLEIDPHPNYSLQRHKTINGPREHAVSRDPVKHITILTIGSRGDVQPFISFSYALKARGYTPRIASFAEYRGWVESHGIEFREIAGDPTTIMTLCVDNGMFTMKFIKEGINQLSWIKELFTTALEATRGTDLILATQSCMIGANLGQAHSVPFMHVFTMPWHKTRHFPHPFMVPDPGSEKGETYNEYSWKLIEGGMGLGLSPSVNAFRKKAGLAPTFVGGPIEYEMLPCLYNFSPLLLPKPSDWPKHVHNTGFWFLDNPDLKWQPPADLLEFLGTEEWGPCVYIGFGSIVVPDPEGMSAAIVDGVKKAGIRAIVSEGWSARGKKKDERDEKLNQVSEKISQLAVSDKTEKELVWPETIYKVKQIPHDWLFPQMAAVVHHGGAGSTAAGLRAGCPTIIHPFFGDQFFWSDVVEKQGLGVRLHELEGNALAAALTKVTTDVGIKANAKRIGEELRQENGQERAVDLLEEELVYARDLMDDLLVSATEKVKVRAQKRKELEERLALRREQGREEARLAKVEKTQGKQIADVARGTVELRLEEEKQRLAKSAASQRILESDSEDERYDFRAQGFKERAEFVINTSGQIAARAAVVGTSLAATGVVLTGKAVTGAVKGAFDATASLLKRPSSVSPSPGARPVSPAPSGQSKV